MNQQQFFFFLGDFFFLLISVILWITYRLPASPRMMLRRDIYTLLLCSAPLILLRFNRPVHDLFMLQDPIPMTYQYPARYPLFNRYLFRARPHQHLIKSVLI